MPRKRINIYTISTIVRKKERDVFDFYHSARAYDGFVLLLDGRGALKVYNSDGTFEDYPVQKGSLMLLRKNDQYSIITDGPCEYITTAYGFGAKHYHDIETLPRVIETDNAIYKEILEMTDIWQSRSWDSYITCKIKLLQIYLSIMRRVEEKQLFADKDIASAVEFIHNNFKRNFTTEELSRYCAMSPSYLRSKFIKKFGITITEYRDNLRLSAAKEMLRSDVFSINDIAESLGYFDASHFSKFFAKKCGLTPSQYASDKKIR